MNNIFLTVLVFTEENCITFPIRASCRAFSRLVLFKIFLDGKPPLEIYTCVSKREKYLEMLLTLLVITSDMLTHYVTKF